MMAAMIASAVAKPGIVPGLPDGAVAHLDFIGGYYYAGGTERAVATLLGPDFVPGDISAAGMEITYANSNRVIAAGALLSDLAALLPDGMTALFEIDHASKPAGAFFYVEDGLDTALVKTSGSPVEMVLDDTYDVELHGGAAGFAASGIQKIAFTLNRDLGGGSWQTACSVNGGTVFSASASYNHFTEHLITIDDVRLFQTPFLGIDVTVRRLTFYAAKPSSELPSLSG
jgi:hypothetical protein